MKKSQHIGENLNDYDQVCMDYDKIIMQSIELYDKLTIAHILLEIR